MGNIIVQEQAKDIRAIARKALRGNWINVTLGVFVYYLLSDVIARILSLIFSSASYRIPLENYDQYINMVTTSGDSLSFVAELYTLVVSGALLVGLSSFMIAFFRKNDVSPANVFDGFEFFGKSFLLYLLYAVKIFLWALLLIVPGIIAAFRYSQCFYILADDPSKGVNQCIEESKFLMNGNKGRLFYLGLTFIGWMLLANIPSGVFMSFTSTSGFIGLIVDVVLSIPIYFVYAYMNTSEMVFYDLVTGRLVAKRVEPEYGFTGAQQEPKDEEPRNEEPLA